MSTLRERSLTEYFLQKRFTFSTNTFFVKIEPMSTFDCWKHAFVFLCNTDCFKKGDTGYWWRGWKWFFPHEQSKLLQNERSECSGCVKFERVFKKLWLYNPGFLVKVKVVFIMARVHPGETPASFVVQVTYHWSANIRMRSFSLGLRMRSHPMSLLNDWLIDWLIENHSNC